MLRRKLVPAWLVCVGVLLFIAPSWAGKADRAKPISISFSEFKLKNGLRVILSEDHSAPTYSICVTYNAGSRDERPGRTGFAHLFEHMMFQGSENVGKGEHFIIIENNGGDMNGTTNADRTNYFEMLPANQLDLGLFLEADRLRSLDISQANFENQRRTVQEERRLGIDNRPYGKTFEAVLETAYDNFPYKHSTIGSMEDLDAATVEDAARFFKTYYAPNNAVLTLVGDFKVQGALAKIRKYFEAIPSQPPPPEPDVAEPEQKGERRKTLDDQFARTPRIDIVYKIPRGNTPDWYALQVLGQVLMGGQSSRLYQKLVKDRQVATSVFGGAQERRGPALLSVMVMARPDKDLQETEKLVYEEIERIKKEPVSDWELQKVRMQLRRGRAQFLQSTLYRAILLGQYSVYYGDPELINTLEAKVSKVTAKDIQRVARTYLKDTNRSVITTAPKARTAAQGARTPSQEPDESKAAPVSKIVRKNKAPVSKEILRVKLPRPVETTLDNGVTVLIMEDHRLPTVFLQFYISGAGALYESADMPGLAGVTAEMLREGTTSRSSKQIAEDIDKLGATLSASSGFGSPEAIVTASGLSDNFDEWFALVTDVLLNPTFPAEELKKLTERRKVQLRQQRASPFFLVTERFNRAVFGDHPAAVVSPTPESLDAMTPEMLAKWHRERYTPQNTILGFAGDVRAAELIPKLNESLAAWKKTDLKEVLPLNPKPAPSKKVHLVDRPESVQTTIAMGNIAIDRRSPDYVPMVVMNRIFGGGPAARLFLNLREEKGYTYGVYSFFNAAKYPGPIRAGGDVRTEVTEGAMNEFLKEIRRIRDEDVPEAELDEAKRAMVANFALSLERPQQLLSYAITRTLYGFPDDYWDTYPAKVMAVTAGDAKAMARKYLDPETLQVVAVGEASKIKPVLEKFGPVEVYDTEGKQAEPEPATVGTVGRQGKRFRGLRITAQR